MGRIRVVVAAIVLTFASVVPARASAIVLDPAFQTSSLAANDDGSTGLTPIGFGLNFFGVNYSSLYINNNGNVTFSAPLGAFTPTGITGGSQATMAPFWGDVDTRPTAGAPPTNLVTYGQGAYGGHNAFGVDWIGVGYFNQSPSTNRNSFQLIIVDRSDIASGDFDFLFNYDQIQWEAGQASGSNSFGCGGVPAHAGWTNGAGTFYELPGSGVSGAFLDSGNCSNVNPSGPNVLTTHSRNSNVAGRYEFNVRSGQVIPPTPVPEPASMLLLLGPGSVLLLAARRKLAK